MFPKIYINKFIFSDEVQFGFSEATASSSHLQILPLLCVIEESPSLKMYGHKLWQSPAIGSSWRAKFGALDQTGSMTIEDPMDKLSGINPHLFIARNLIKS